MSHAPHRSAAHPTLSADEALAMTAVLEGCHIARRVLAGPGHARVWHKPDGSPVTAADFAVQCWVAHRLATAGCVLPLIGEESAACLREAGAAMLEITHAALPEAHRPKQPAVLLEWLACVAGTRSGTPAAWWLIDPIDGTKGFLSGGQYAICLALIRDGQPEFGLLGCPALPRVGMPPATHVADTGILLLGRRGVGAWQTPLGDAGQWQPIHCSEASLASPRIRVCESRDALHGQHGLLDVVLTRMGVIPTPLRLDSQCNYALVARGDAEVFVRQPRDPDYVEKTWDHAAGAIIAEAAGACVSDLDGHALDFTRGAHLPGRGVLVAAPSWHAALIEALRTDR